ncbi:hypothetical protein [Halpernia sp. GG3]
MNKIILIPLLLICVFCEKKLIYQPPKEDINTLIELALNSCEIYKNQHNYFVKNKVKVYINFKNMKNPLSRDILYFGIIANNLQKNFSRKNNEFLISVYYLKKTREKEFCLKYHIESDNKDVEIKLIYENNKWQLFDFNIINY